MFQAHRSRHILRLEGELTIYHAAEARDLFQKELAKGAPLELDLSGLGECDTAGAQVLLWLKREGQAKGFLVPFLHHSPVVLEVIDQLNLAGTFGDTLVIAPPA
jgi:anti-sigma B factor antagonist